jgi:hypothetical protein
LKSEILTMENRGGHWATPYVHIHTCVLGELDLWSKPSSSKPGLNPIWAEFIQTSPVFHTKNETGFSWTQILFAFIHLVLQSLGLWHGIFVYWTRKKLIYWYSPEKTRHKWKQSYWCQTWIKKQVYIGDGPETGGGVLERTLYKHTKELNLVFTDTSLLS